VNVTARVAAPGKVLLTGSYAVLEGAPAIVCAVDRLAIASAEAKGAATAEVAAAMEGEEPPGVDVSGLFAGQEKLGLGSSAAAVVAALGYRAAMRGEDLASADVRRTIFDRARRAHARVQSGGSGVDIAASVHGGVLRYELSAEGPLFRNVPLPTGLFLDTYWSGRSVRTSDMRARVDGLKGRDAKLHGARMSDLATAANAAASAIDDGKPRDFIEAARAAERGLIALGRDADAPIVPPFAGPLAKRKAEPSCPRALAEATSSFGWGSLQHPRVSTRWRARQASSDSTSIWMFLVFAS
jgi:phosphomevalonate kinase